MDANLIEHEVRPGSCALGWNPASDSERGEGFVMREAQEAVPRPHEPIRLFPVATSTREDRTLHLVCLLCLTQTPTNIGLPESCPRL